MPYYMKRHEKSDCFPRTKFSYIVRELSEEIGSCLFQRRTPDWFCKLSLQVFAFCFTYYRYPYTMFGRTV